MILRLLPFIISGTTAARPPSEDDFVLRSDCQIELWAAEPDVVDPVGLTFDAAGRAFVLEMRDYPYGMDGKGQPGGTVRLLEDTNGDGKPDKASVFAEGLRFATSICAVKDGVVVSAPPEIIFLADRDGDGKAEVREVWFTGFAAGVTDSNFNGLRWHMDGRIHGVNGGNGGLIVNPKQPDKVTRLAELDFAFDPQTLKITTTYPTGGGFGLVFDDAGRSFVTHNINHMQMRILPQSVLDEVPGGSPLRGTQNISVHGENCRIYPIHDAQTRPNHPEQAGYFSSAGGMGYLNHSGWPASMANSLFVCDAASGIVHREVLSPDGPILKCQRPPDELTSEFLAGKDPAFRPVGVELGPDGALYVIDMQRDVIEHPDYIPPRMKSRVDLRAGSDRGRIWRITPKAGLPKADKLPAKASVEERVALLGSPNQWTRLTAQRLLIEQPDEKAVPLLQSALAAGSERTNVGEPSPTAQMPYSPVHALWTFFAMNKVDRPQYLAAGYHTVPEVQAAWCDAGLGGHHRMMIPALERDMRDERVLWANLLLAKPSKFSASDTAKTAQRGIEILKRHGGDKWMRAAALRAIGIRADQAIEFIKSGECGSPEAVGEIARAQNKPNYLVTVLELARQAGPVHLAAATEGALAAMKAQGWQLDLPAEWLQSKEPAVLHAALTLESAGAVFDTSPDRDALLATILQSIGSNQSIPAKSSWLRLLRHFPLEKSSATLLPALYAGEPVEFQQAALECLRARSESEVATRIVKDWPLIAPSLRPALAALMVDRREFRPALADALVSGAIKPGEISLDLEQRRTLLRHSGDEIKNKVSKFLTDDEYSNRAALVDEWLVKLPATGDAARGKVAYQKLCFQCHRAGGIGHEVGPDLAAQSHRSVEDLLTHILDPDAAINPNYAAFMAETDDGQKHTGILVSSSGANIVLRQAMGLKVELPREKVKKLESTGHSLMPAGMEAAYTPQEMRDLIAFLQQRP